ncbi:unnamed protein product [Trifolium pratense]|uniref:Uncharacterized protein n=1 Tax=Trifolium pratense TaxID=57577 RepID=A0ACB0IHD9_TRIPR|nr:unnamed protein product [Trifolium pratense]
MFNLKLAKHIEFQEHLNENSDGNSGINFTATVLARAFWPSSYFPDPNIAGPNIPSEMVKCVEDFEGFYETRRKGRKLRWIFSLGSCNINGNFESKTIELIVSTYQVIAFLRIQEAD